jgi:hypothetical protein
MSKKHRTPDDEAAYEHALEVLHDLRARLAEGAKGSGLTLTADECKKLTAAEWRLPPLQGRPLRNDASSVYRIDRIASYCFALEQSGKLLKEAVGLTAEKLCVSSSAVYAARAHFLSK